jgi:DNA-binding XRE family transcriptional regulator
MPGMKRDQSHRLQPGISPWAARRVAAGLTQSKLAQLTGIPRNTIVLIEAGRWVIDPDEAAALARVLGSSDGAAA